MRIDNYSYWPTLLGLYPFYSCSLYIKYAIIDLLVVISCKYKLYNTILFPCCQVFRGISFIFIIKHLLSAVL